MGLTMEAGRQNFRTLAAVLSSSSLIYQAARDFEAFKGAIKEVVLDIQNSVASGDLGSLLKYGSAELDKLIYHFDTLSPKEMGRCMAVVPLQGTEIAKKVIKRVSVVLSLKKVGTNPKKLSTSSRPVKGFFGEEIVKQHYEKLGYRVFQPKYGSNNGIDLIAVKFKASGKVKEIIIHEAKYSASGYLNLPVKGGVRQMSKDWVKKGSENMKMFSEIKPEKYGDFKPLLKLLKENKTKIAYRASVLDKKGDLTFFDLTEMCKK